MKASALGVRWLETRNVGKSTRPRVEGVLRWQPAVVPRAERRQLTGQGQPLNQRARRLPGGSCSCHRQQLILKRPPVVVESPPAIADIDMAHHRLPGLLEPDWREPRRRIPLQERPRQDVARARSKERLIATLPRQQLISPLRGGPPVTRRRYVSHENYITTPAARTYLHLALWRHCRVPGIHGCLAGPTGSGSSCSAASPR